MRPRPPDPLEPMLQFRLYAPLSFLAVFLFGAVAGTSEAQDTSFICTTEHTDVPPAAAKLAYQDSLRMLIVLVRFQDDDSDGSGTVAPNRWPDQVDGNPIPYTEMPAWGPTLLAPDPALVSDAHVTPADSSLSAFFYNQSKNGAGGPHILWGDVWPRKASGTPEVYVTAQPEAYYVNDDSLASRGWGYLTQEVLDSLAVSPGFDIGDYDYDRNGSVDHIMFVVRRADIHASIGNGEEALDGPVPDVSGWPDTAPSSQRLEYWSPSRQAIVNVDRYGSGSYMVVGYGPGRAGLIHEYMHDLFSMGHTWIIGDNGVPAEKPFGVGGPCWFNRMCGTGTVVRGASKSNYDIHTQSLSGHELRRQEWADVRSLSPTSGDQLDVHVKDLYNSGEVVLIPLAAGSAASHLSIENRQRTSFFDEEALYQSPDPFYGRIRYKLTGTGMLVSLSQGRYFGLMPPDNRFGAYVQDTLRIVTPCDGTSPHCQGVDLYETDVHQPSTSNQVSPWTRPNVSGYNGYPTGQAPNWFAVNDIRYTGGANGEMAFDFMADVRAASVFTVTTDSWMGTESDGLVLGKIRVTNGATLTIEPGVSLTFTDGIFVEQGATLVVGTGATISLGPGERIIAQGDLIATDATFQAVAGATWKGIRIGVPTAPSFGGGSTPVAPSDSRLNGVVVSNVDFSSELVGSSAYPPFSAIEVYDTSVDIGGGSVVADVVKGNGISVSGSQGAVFVQGETTRIRDNDGLGVLALGGGRATIRDRALVTLNKAGGARASGTGSVVDLRTNGRVDDNDVVGLLAENNASASVSTEPHPTHNTSVSQNDAGPTALSGGSVADAACTFTACRPSAFVENWLGGSYDAKALGGSSVILEDDFWGTGRQGLIQVVDKSSFIDLFPTAPTPDGLTGGGTTASARGSQTAASKGGPSQSREIAGGALDLLSPAMVAAEQLRRATARRDSNAVLGHLVAALALVVTDDDRAAVFSAATSAVAQWPTESVVAVIAESTGLHGAWADRALAVAHAAGGDLDAADAIALSLSADGLAAHAAFGHGLRVRIAVAQRDAQAARGRLDAFPDTGSEHVEHAYAAALALAIATFPELGDDASGRSADPALASSKTESGLADALRVYPNPSAGAARVALALAEATPHLTAAVYDALGRRVATLHDGPAADGAHAFAIDADALAPGVYVVVARADGAAPMTARLTVVR